MSTTARPRTGPTPRADTPAALLERVRAGGNDDGTLFALFAELAREADRPDLRAEFLARAGGKPAPPAAAVNGHPPPAAGPPPKPGADGPTRSAEAKAHADRGRRLIRDGKLAEAEAAFRDAVRLDPAVPTTHCDLGVALGRLGRPAEAEAAFRVAVSLDPTGVVGYLNLGSACLDQKKPAEAEGWFRQAVHLDPGNASARHMLGSALEARGQRDPAEAAYRAALACDPTLADAHFRLGELLARMNRPAEAEAAFREAVLRKPKHARAWGGLGHVLETQGRAADAEPMCREAVRLDPGFPEAHNNLGVVLAALGRPAEAEACYREAIRLREGFAPAHSNLGNALRVQGRLAEAERALREAVRLEPRAAEGHNNLGIVLVQAGRPDEAVRCYDEAIRLRPDYPEARLNRALAYLADGDFARGWPEYEWRFKMRHVNPPKHPGPRWDGSPLAGKTVLVHAEQGLGDTLHFIRYAPLVKARGGTVLVECPEVLRPLVATCPGVDRVVGSGAPLPAFDTHVPLLSLPGILGVPPDASPAPVPYFSVDPARVEHWRAELGAVPGFRVGVVWQGSKSHKGDHIRSVPLTRFAGLAGVPGVRLVSLQKGYGTEQLAAAAAAGLGVVDVGGKTGAGMEDTAAVLPALDLVVTVDTSVAHLAGALGVPVWVAVPHASDWRWLRHRADTPWYPTMRLFRQPEVGDWDAVFERLRAELEAAVAAKGGG